EDGIRDDLVTGVQTCALPIYKQKHLPTVPVHDLVVHRRDRELVIGTHGRGIWIMDVLPLQEMTAANLLKDFHLCTVRDATAYRRSEERRVGKGCRSRRWRWK